LAVPYLVAGKIQKFTIPLKNYSRMDTRLKTMLLCLLLLGSSHVFAQTAERIYLSGQGPSDAVGWDFHCSSGRQSGEWTRIPVPSNWEQHGFGGYDYGHVSPEEKHDEVGTYKTTFQVPASWRDQYVRLVFEGAMTETSIKVNGIPVGTPNQGGYLPFRYPLNSPQAYANNCLKYGEVNELEVRVAKRPSNASLDVAERSADYWVFGGIYRPVYLEVLPKAFLHRLAIDARADGSLVVDVFPQIHRPLKFRQQTTSFIDQVEAQVLNLKGEVVGEAFSAPVHGATGRLRLTTNLDKPALWSPEFPHLYQLRVRLQNQGETVFEKTERFGFRSFELRTGEGLYLNGQKLKIKGINRNVFRPATARAIDPEQAWEDARMIKAMNANLVRSHLPPTKAFMEACDQLGLLVITELTNWQKPFIDAPVARNLVYEMVALYQNHPSVILWANGNEGGFNVEVDEIYHLVDLQDRPVIHPWGVFEGIDALHYPSYAEVQAKTEGKHVYLPTELLHGLYDGGHGAGLEDYWSLMMDSPISAGGVLWCWADAAVSRTDRYGELDTDGNHSADGIVGPNGEKEASYFSVREIWSPVQLEKEALASDFDGRFPVKNHYLFTSLEQCQFEWQLNRYQPFHPDKDSRTQKTASGELQGPKVLPGSNGEIQVPLPEDWADNDALVLRATDPHGQEVMAWTWPIQVDKLQAEDEDLTGPRLLDGNIIVLGNTKWTFDKKTGKLMACEKDGQMLGLSQGPVLYLGTKEGVLNRPQNWTARFKESQGTVRVEARNRKDGSTFVWTFTENGKVELRYDFAPPEEPLTYCAVGFDLPEASVLSKQWLGQGPHRIWGNRQKGPQFGLWQNEAVEAVPGESWEYPAFKGIFGQVDWMSLQLEGGLNLTVDPQLRANIGLLQPDNAKVVEGLNNTGPKKAVWDYPGAGGLYVFHKLPAVGTKFKRAEQLGPQSQPQVLTEIKGTIRFRVSD
jgi:hypothetical protein